MPGWMRPAAFIETYWGGLIDQVANPPQDAKTALQEWAQGRGLAPPDYSLERKEGPDHAPDFLIAVSVEGYAAEQGSGSSKRKAQQEAAKKFLVREGVWNDD